MTQSDRVRAVLPPSALTLLSALFPDALLTSDLRINLRGVQHGGGRLGQVERHCDGQDCHGCPVSGPALAVYSTRPRLFRKLWAIPGLRRWQTGDAEMRAVFPAEAGCPSWPG